MAKAKEKRFTVILESPDKKSKNHPDKPARRYVTGFGETEEDVVLLAEENAIKVATAEAEKELGAGDTAGIRRRAREIVYRVISVEEA